MFRIFLAAFLAVTMTVYASEGESSNKNNTIDIKGSIVDIHNGQALTGVCVKLAGTNQETYTDFDGNFEFENISTGEYKIISEYISYKTNVTSIESRNNQRIVISLESL